MDADLLVVLTDIDGLYTADPNVDPTAQFIAEVDHVDASIEAMAGRNRHPWAKGGMATKLEAARLVTTSGISMVMCRGLAEDAVTKAVSGEPIGTLFKPAGSKLEARRGGCWATSPTRAVWWWTPGQRGHYRTTTGVFFPRESPR